MARESADTPRRPGLSAVNQRRDAVIRLQSGFPNSKRSDSLKMQPVFDLKLEKFIYNLLKTFIYLFAHQGSD